VRKYGFSREALAEKMKSVVPKSHWNRTVLWMKLACYPHSVQHTWKKGFKTRGEANFKTTLRYPFQRVVEWTRLELENQMTMACMFNRVAKSTGAPLEVCLEELRKQLKPPAAEAAKASKVRRFEFQSSPEGLLTGAKLIEE
jgi:hypothetical protein